MRLIITRSPDCGVAFVLRATDTLADVPVPIESVFSALFDAGAAPPWNSAQIIALVPDEPPEIGIVNVSDEPPTSSVNIG